jgi:methanogenic corrinoid protein MtbC1
MSEDEIILSELSDDELVQQMHDDLYDGLKEEIEEGHQHPSRARLGAL